MNYIKPYLPSVLLYAAEVGFTTAFWAACSKKTTLSFGNALTKSVAGSLMERIAEIARDKIDSKIPKETFAHTILWFVPVPFYASMKQASAIAYNISGCELNPPDSVKHSFNDRLTNTFYALAGEALLGTCLWFAAKAIQPLSPLIGRHFESKMPTELGILSAAAMAFFATDIVHFSARVKSQLQEQTV